MNAKLHQIIQNLPLTIPQRDYIVQVVEESPIEIQAAWMALLQTMDEADLRTMGDVLMAQKEVHEGRISPEHMARVQEELITSADRRAALVEELQGMSSEDTEQ